MKALEKYVRVRKLKTVPNKYGLCLLGYLLCKSLTPLSAVKLLKDRSREHVYRRTNVNNLFSVVNKSIREFYLEVMQVKVLSRSPRMVVQQTAKRW